MDSGILIEVSIRSVHDVRAMPGGSHFKGLIKKQKVSLSKPLSQKSRPLDALLARKQGRIHIRAEAAAVPPP